jgi:hypothetical protein
VDNLVEIDSLTRATRRREFDDGLVDILYGIVFLVLGLGNWFLFSTTGLTWFATALVQQREIMIIALVALVPALLLAVLGLRRLIARIRRAYLWKDDGYVEPLQWQVRRSVTILAVLVSVAMIIAAVWLMAAGSLDEAGVLRVLAASVSVGTAIIYLGMGIDLQIRRYIGVGIVGLIPSGIVLARAGSFSESWLLIGIGWMIILTLSGLWALRQSVLTLAGSPSE